MLHIILDKVFFWLAAGLIAIDAYYVLFHKGIPNIRTAPPIRARIIELLKADFHNRRRETYTIVDLGSGNGLFTREIAKALPDACVIGVEITRQSVWWSNWLKRRNGLTNLTYRKMDFFSYDFAEADAVVMYLIPEVMGKLGEKLHAEMRSGTLMTSNKFKLGDGWQPDEVLQIKTLYPHQGQLFVYRKNF